jgi:hypothetical protein
MANNVHILKKRVGGRLSSYRVAAFPIPRMVIAIRNGLIKRCRGLDLWRLFPGFQSEVGPSNMLTCLFGPQPQPSVSSCRRDFNFGAFRRKA